MEVKDVEFTKTSENKAENDKRIEAYQEKITAITNNKKGKN